MIQANELRVGNWLECNGKFYKVVRITNEQIRANPIPLTEEWLVKLGFEKIVWDDFTFFRNKGLDIEIHDGGFYANRKIENVHTLQNLYFAITGEELTIKN